MAWFSLQETVWVCWCVGGESGGQSGCWGSAAGRGCWRRQGACKEGVRTEAWIVEGTLPGVAGGGQRAGRDVAGEALEIWDGLDFT